MPPEQFGDRTVPASDLYSLGATLIAVVTGSHPADLPQKDGRIQFEHIANISPTFADWLKWMTEPCLERRLKSASFALQALEKQALREDLSLVATQPAGSRVVLTKKHNYLEIIIPPKGFSLDLLPTIWLAVSWSVPGVTWLFMTILSWSWVGWVAHFFAYPFLLMGGEMIKYILLALFVPIRLHIDREQIALSYQLFGVEYYHHSPAPRQQIIKLERTRTFYKRDADGNAVQVKSQINIWAGTQKFEIGCGGLLSEPELDWLAHELSDWLELPISSNQ
jgi:serine/threonine protein kinase